MHPFTLFSSDGHLFHVVIFTAADNLKGLHIKSSSGLADPLPFFAFPGWGVVIIVDAFSAPDRVLSFATAAAAAALRRELGTVPPHMSHHPPSYIIVRICLLPIPLHSHLLYNDTH
jgi:hypothetical protein